MGRLFVTTAVLALAATVVSAQAPGPSQALKERVTAFRAAWNAHDAAAVAALYAPDADQIMGDGAITHGKAAVQKWWADRFVTTPKGTAINFTVSSVRVISTDVAVINVVASVTGPAPKGGGMSTTDDRGTWVMIRQNGQWLLSALRVQQAESRAP